MRLLYAFSALAGASVLAGSAASQTTVYYQPTPYPAGATRGVHIVDGWLPSTYNGRVFMQDDRLQVGGWGDEYRTYLQFDVTGLPARVQSAELQLYARSRGDSSSTTEYYLSSPNQAWVNFGIDTGVNKSDSSPRIWSKTSRSLTWSNQPSLARLNSFRPQSTNSFWRVGITGLYNDWHRGRAANTGIALSPRYTNNRFNVFHSSRSTSDGRRPVIALTFTPPVTVPSFRIPLPSDARWLVTTEAGGFDCNGVYDQFHDGLNYFSVDFGWSNTGRYTNPDLGGPTGQIPVLAAATGRVNFVGNDRNHANGYHVVIAHNTQNSADINNGFSTRYLHLKARPIVAVGARVTRGDTIGYMGNTGISRGPHLHFGIRYENRGVANSNVMYATVNGMLMKSFQTECRGNTPIRYY